MFRDESEIVHGRIGAFGEERGKEHVPQLGHNTPNGGDLFQYILLHVTPCFLIPGYNIYIRHLQNRTFDGFMHKKDIWRPDSDPLRSVLHSYGVATPLSSAVR